MPVDCALQNAFPASEGTIQMSASRSMLIFLLDESKGGIPNESVGG